MRCKLLQDTGWCVKCSQGRQAVQSFPGHFGYRKPRPTVWEDDRMQFIKRSANAPGAKPGGVVATDPHLTAHAPALQEWLTVAVWEDGKPRQSGTMMLLSEGGYWKAWLHDRDAKRTCWLTATSLSVLLDLVEETLMTGGGEWRQDRK